MSQEIVVVGCGYWGKNLVRNFNELNALAMVCEATESGRATAAALAPHIPAVADIITAATREFHPTGTPPALFGDGRASERAVKLIKDKMNNVSYNRIIF